MIEDEIESLIETWRATRDCAAKYEVSTELYDRTLIALKAAKAEDPWCYDMDKAPSKCIILNRAGHQYTVHVDDELDPDETLYWLAGTEVQNLSASNVVAWANLLPLPKESE